MAVWQSEFFFHKQLPRCSSIQVHAQDQYGNVSLEGISADAPMELKILRKAAEADSEVEAAVPDLMCYFSKVCISFPAPPGILDKDIFHIILEEGCDLNVTSLQKEG